MESFSLLKMYYHRCRYAVAKSFYLIYDCYYQWWRHFYACSVFECNTLGTIESDSSLEQFVDYIVYETKESKHIFGTFEELWVIKATSRRNFMVKSVKISLYPICWNKLRLLLHLFLYLCSILGPRIYGGCKISGLATHLEREVELLPIFVLYFWWPIICGMPRHNRYKNSCLMEFKLCSAAQSNIIYLNRIDLRNFQLLYWTSASYGFYFCFLCHLVQYRTAIIPRQLHIFDKLLSVQPAGTMNSSMFRANSCSCSKDC